MAILGRHFSLEAPASEAWFCILKTWKTAVNNKDPARMNRYVSNKCLKEHVEGYTCVVRRTWTHQKSTVSCFFQPQGSLKATSAAKPRILTNLKHKHLWQQYKRPRWAASALVTFQSKIAVELQGPINPNPAILMVILIIIVSSLKVINHHQHNMVDYHLSIITGLKLFSQIHKAPWVELLQKVEGISKTSSLLASCYSTAARHLGWDTSGHWMGGLNHGTIVGWLRTTVCSCQ